MPIRSQPADEPLESLDLELGAVLRSWTEAHANEMTLDLSGPLEAASMDATWVLRILGEQVEADVILLYGPTVDINVFRPGRLEDGIHVGGGRGITGERLAAMLDDLDAVNRGADLPEWLRPVA